MATYDLGTMPGTDPSPVVSLGCLPHFTAVETMPWQASWCRRRFSVPLCLAHPAARRSAFLLFKEATQRAWKAHISGEQGTGMLIKDLAPRLRSSPVPPTGPDLSVRRSCSVSLTGCLLSPASTPTNAASRVSLQAGQSHAPLL